MSVFDTTGAESCRRCGENARAEVERLQAENAQLRELVFRFHRTTQVLRCSDSDAAQCRECPLYIGEVDCEVTELMEKMQELGIEVGS